MRIAFIGGGTMGEAMVRCLLRAEVATFEDIVVSDIDESRRDYLSKEYKVNTLSDNRKAAEGSDVIILAIKPQDLAAVMEEIKGASPQQLVLSIMAGISLSHLSQDLNHPSIVRAMPNMLAQIGEAVTVWTATPGVSLEQSKQTRLILGALGEEIYVQDEKYIDMATALSGSGPAYIFLIIESLIDAGVHIGLSRNIAQKLVTQTMLGSIHLEQRLDIHPAALRNLVTSPGGTTTEALLRLEKGGLRSLFIEAVAAAYGKAKRL